MSNGSNEGDESDGGNESDGEGNSKSGGGMQHVDKSYDSSMNRHWRTFGSRR